MTTDTRDEKVDMTRTDVQWPEVDVVANCFPLTNDLREVAMVQVYSPKLIQCWNHYLGFSISHFRNCSRFESRVYIYRSLCPSVCSLREIAQKGLFGAVARQQCCGELLYGCAQTYYSHTFATQ